jgi:hypothetical protein
MKSLQVQYYVPVNEQPYYTDLQVMRSAAGFYVGTVYVGEDGFQEPGSRDTCYVPHKEQAEKMLAILEDANTRYNGDIFKIINHYESEMQMLGWDNYGVGYRLTP